MPGANIEWKKRNQNSPKQELAINYNLKKEEQISSTLIPIKNPPFIERPSIEYAAINSLITKEKLNIGNINPKYPGCDTIFLKTGEQIKAKVLEVGQSEIKYKLCDNLNGPTFIMNIVEVLKIKYYIETSIISLYNEVIPPLTSSVTEKKQEPSSLGGFISGVAGILLIFTIIAPFILGLVGLITSLTGLEKINKNPEKWKGKQLANAGIVLGIINLILSVTFITVILSLSLSSGF